MSLEDIKIYIESVQSIDIPDDLTMSDVSDDVTGERVIVEKINNILQTLRAIREIPVPDIEDEANSDSGTEFFSEPVETLGGMDVQPVSEPVEGDPLLPWPDDETKDYILGWDSTETMYKLYETTTECP